MGKNHADFAVIRQAHAALAALHPDLFSLENPTPLKIGIHQDIKSRYPELSWKVINGLMRWLTIRRAYLATLKAGTPRMGFDGPLGAVTEKQEHWASQVFDLRNKRAHDPWPVSP